MGCSLYCSTCIFVAVSPHLTSRFFITLHSLCPHTSLPVVLYSVPTLRTTKSQRHLYNLSFLVLLWLPELGDRARISVINKRSRKDVEKRGRRRQLARRRTNSSSVWCKRKQNRQRDNTNDECACSWRKLNDSGDSCPVLSLSSPYRVISSSCITPGFPSGQEQLEYLQQ